MSNNNIHNQFTPAEQTKLKEFKERIHHIYPECDEKCITWLRARELNLDKAEQMLRRYLIWRKNNEIDKLASWKSPKVYLPFTFLGYDFDSEPVFLLPFGKWELRTSIEIGDIVPCLRFVYQCLETVVSTAYSNNKYNATIIFDFDGFSYRQLTHRTVVQGIIEVLRVFEANYPEVLKLAFVINAPKIFNLLFTIIKPLLHSRTLAKVQIYNNDVSNWSQALFKTMSKDILPPYWGGTKIGVDEYCSESWFQEPLPHYFMKKLATNFDEFGDEWTTVKIPAREVLTLDFKLEGVVKENVDSVLKWGFYTESYDIGFTVLYCKEQDREVVAKETHLIPFARIESNNTNKTFGSLNVYKAGKYVVQFDNSYSRSRSKLIHYSISLTSVETSPKMMTKQHGQRKNSIPYILEINNTAVDHNNNESCKNLNDDNNKNFIGNNDEDDESQEFQDAKELTDELYIIGAK